jgi:hypothetical protein
MQQMVNQGSLETGIGSAVIDNHLGTEALIISQLNREERNIQMKIRGTGSLESKLGTRHGRWEPYPQGHISIPAPKSQCVHRFFDRRERLVFMEGPLDG